MGAVFYRARALRTSWRAVVGLALLAGIGAGIAIAIAAGARRTDTAHSRFVRASRAADVFMATDQDVRILETAAHLPQVVAVTRGVSFDTAQTLDAGAFTDGGFSTSMNRFKLLEGRAADPDRIDEAVASFSAREQLGVHAGDLVTLTFDGPRRFRFRFRVVGVEVSPGELPPSIAVGPSLHLTRAFGLKYGPRFGVDHMIEMRLRHGEADIPAFSSALQRATGGEAGAFTLFQRDQSANVERSFHLQASALWIVAALLGAAVLVITAQLLARQSALEAAGDPTLRALGMTTAQRWAIGFARVAVVAIVGGVIATATAIAISPVFPLGLPRVAEPTPGVRFDIVVLPFGALVVVGVVLLTGGVAQWRVARRNPLVSAVPSARRRFGRAATSHALARRPATAVGLNFALDPGRGVEAVPLRSTVFGAVIALVALTSALIFGSSLQHLLATPRLYGFNWDVTFEGPSQPLDKGPVPAFVKDDRIRGVAVTSLGLPLQVGSQRTDVIVADVVKGDIAPVLLDGRAPRRANEVMLGSVTLRKIGAHVDDMVPVSIPGISRKPVRMRVVGRGVLPAQTENARLGEGAILSGRSFTEPLVPKALFAQQGDPGYDSGAITFAPGVDRRSAIAEYRRRFGNVTFHGAQKPSDLVNFGRVQRLPIVLAGLLATLGIAVFTYLLTTSVRRRRRDLAVLKALGFARREVRVVLGAQATVVAAITAFVGVPLGIVAGRIAWVALAGRLGVPARPVVELPVIALIVVFTMVTANIVGAIPGFFAARVRPATVLRTK